MGIWCSIQAATGVAQKVYPSPHALEPLESRLLLSADSLRSELPAPLQAGFDNPAMQVTEYKHLESITQTEAEEFQLSCVPGHRLPIHHVYEMDLWGISGRPGGAAWSGLRQVAKRAVTAA